MMRYTPWAMALALSSIVSAHAGRHHANVAVVATFGHSPFFFDPFFHRPFFSQPFCHPFCRSAVLPSFSADVPPPPAFYGPPVYYAPPPLYYYPPPAAAAPPAPSQGGSPYSKEDCRQTETTITIDGQAQRLVGTVCKGPDGNWHTAP